MKSIGTTDLRDNKKYDRLIPEVRDKLRQKLTQQPGSYYESDLERAMASDWAVRRYLLKLHSVDAAVSAMVKAFQWYKTMQLRETKEEDLIRELYAVGAVFRYEDDIDGRPTIYFRLCRQRWSGELKEVLSRQIFRVILKADDDANAKGVTLVSDLNGISLGKVHIDMSMSLGKARDYFIHTVVNILIVDLMWIGRAALNVIKYALPEEVRCAFTTVSKKELVDYIDEKNIPDFLGGSCQRAHSGDAAAPPGCVSLSDYACRVLKIDDEKINKLSREFYLSLNIERLDQCSHN